MICPFFGYLIASVKKGQESGGQRERGKDMQQNAAGRTQTRADRSQPYGMWSPAQRTELNQRPCCSMS